SSGGPLARALHPLRADVCAGQDWCGRPAYAVRTRAASRRSEGRSPLRRVEPVTLPSNSLPSTLADSPHVQRFTKRSIVGLLRRHGFRVDEVQGSVLMCGPFTVLMMEGFRFFPRINGRAGKAFPVIAAGFVVACTRPSVDVQSLVP
ncbi:MAG: hypothetical protein LC808_13870, partial [Actinobacteria bacterium]|nr:hypothetical protein [Actinomycetota bacterium]